MSKPKVLVLAPDLPYPVRAGGQMRMASLLTGLAKFATLFLACIAQSIPEETERWVQGLGATITHHPRPGMRSAQLWKERALMLATGSNLMLRRDEQRFFDRQFTACAPAVVWLETPYLLRYALPWQRQAPLVVDYWGTSVGAQRDFHYARGARKLWEWMRWRAAVGGERTYAPRIDHIVTVSTLDAEHFRSLAPNSSIWPIPIGILTPASTRVAPVERRPAKPQRLIMTGDLSYRPNVDAARYFVTDILPIIRAAHPEVEVQIVGRKPCAEVRALAAVPGVQVLGEVPDLSKAIQQAAVYILPMRLGSGIRSKLFEVFPLGKPIVSTSRGAEGLELLHNQNCYIADDPPEFARACLHLLQHPDDQQRLGDNAKRLAREVYSQRSIERLLETTLHAIMQQRVESNAAR